MGKYKKSAAPKKPPLTHFLCLPLITAESRPKLEASLKNFKEAVTSSTAQQSGTTSSDEAAVEVNEKISSHIHPKAVRPVGALHLTLGVMSLNERELTEAVHFLKELDIKAILDKASPRSNDSSGNAIEGVQSSSPDAPSTAGALGPLQLHLKGLESMHPPQRTSILYAAPSDITARLYPFCAALQEMFKEKDFLVSDDRKLKLHATIVNTIYAKGRKQRPAKSQLVDQTSNIPTRTQDLNGSQGHGPNANAPLRIDARSLLEHYKDFEWADSIKLDRVAICEMGTKKILDENGNIVDERYTEVAAVPLPTT